MCGMNPGEILMLLFIIALVFGIGRLPQLGEAIGKARRKHNRALEGKDEIDITPKGKKPDTIEDAEIVG